MAGSLHILFTSLNLGIGGAVAKLTSLDWQTYDFVPGSLITVRLDNMTNIPDGMDWGVIDGNLINIAVGRVMILVRGAQCMYGAAL